MLLWVDRVFGQGIFGADLWQTLVIFINNRVVAPFFIDPHKTIKEHDLPGGAQADLSIAGSNFNRRAFQTRRCHLAGECPFPNQVIEFLLIRVGYG